MAAQYGRTVDRWFAFKISDSAGTLRQIPVETIAGLGVNYPVVNLPATQDAGIGGLPDTPEFKLTITGPFDTTASTGSHTVLSGVNGASVPLSFDAQQGIRHPWEAGEPQFGITKGAVDGVLVTNYQVDLAAMKYSADIILSPGSALPAWGIAAEA